MSTDRPRVGVIGGGVIGLCCAFELDRQGADVVVLERGECGRAASWGNAGWVVPALSGPLASPRALRDALGWVLKRHSPIRVKPRADRELVRWIRHFVRSSSSACHASGFAAKLALAAQTMRLFDELQRAGVQFEMHRTGLLVVALSESGLANARRELGAAAAAGYAGRARTLDAPAARALEPALSPGIAGGVLLEDERHVRPETLVRGLRSHLLERDVEIRERAEVHELLRGSGGQWQLRCANGVERVDRVIVAAGAWSSELLRPLGFRLLLQPARGCSVTATGQGAAPTRALKLYEARVACTPFDGAVRISGTFELNGFDASLDGRRLEGVARAAAPYLRDWAPASPGLRWSGLRSVTPDDLPFIGEVPRQRHLYIATGHGTLGLTLAPATAAQLAPVVVRGDATALQSAFRPDRF